LYFWAKRGLSQLRISTIVRNGRTQYFRTLLLQGGLPVKSLQEGNNKANYGAFFEGLIKYTNEVNIEYEDVSFIDYLPCKNRLAASFQTPDFYELNLLIIDNFREKGEESEYWELIQAIFDREEDTSGGQIQRIKELINKKKEKTLPTQSSFSIDWQLKKIESEVSLHYTLVILQQIRNTDVAKEMQTQYELSLFLNNKEIAKYYRSLPDNQGNVYFVNARGKDELTAKVIDNSDVVLRLSNNGSFKEFTFSAPDFSEPVLLQGLETVWNVKKKQQNDNRNAVLLLPDSEWDIVEPASIETVIFNNQKCSWIEADEIIKLKHTSTNEEIVYDNTPFIYHFEAYQRPDIQSKNRKLINSQTQFKVIYSIDNEIINKDFEIYFRTKQGTWIKYYNSNALPTGLLYFKFKYPDNKTDFVNFFNIGNLNINYSNQTANSGVIGIDNWNGLIQSHEDKGIIRIEKLPNNKWELVRDTENRYYANDILFRINDSQGGFADIFVAPPFRGVVVSDFDGNSVENGETIALHSLWQYKCIVLGSNDTTVSVFHNVNCNNKRTFRYTLDKRHEIPLSDFDETVKNLFTLFGTDHTNYDSVIIKVGNDYAIHIKAFNVNVLREEWIGNKVVKLDNGDNISHLFAINPDCEYPDAIDIIELSKTEDGFQLSEMGEETTSVIVFSDEQSSTFRVRPTFLPLSENQIPVADRQDAIRIKLTEARFIDDIWYTTVVYFKILTSNNLPLKTLDVFRIIAETPLLCAKLAMVLLDHQEWVTPEERKNGLLQFENEFALAWHWIDNQTWQQAIEWIGKFNDIADYYIQDLLKYSLMISDESARDYFGMMSNTIMINQNIDIDAQKLIRSYLNRFDKDIRIDNNDWCIKNENGRVLFPLLKPNWNDFLFNGGEFGYFLKPFLFAPPKAALSIMGQDDGYLWKQENEIQRRIMYYYWKLNPEAYTELFLAMVKKINYRLNNR
jgi:hypothetical protein